MDIIKKDGKEIIVLPKPTVRGVIGLREIMQDCGHRIDCNFTKKELRKIQAIKKRRLKAIKKK